MEDSKMIAGLYILTMSIEEEIKSINSRLNDIEKGLNDLEVVLHELRERMEV